MRPASAYKLFLWAYLSFLAVKAKTVATCLVHLSPSVKHVIVLPVI